MKQRPIPMFVTLWQTELKFEHPNQYFRDAGGWGIEFYWDGDVLKASSSHKYLLDVNDIPLVASTYEKWCEDNRGYIEDITCPKELLIYDYQEANEEIIKKKIEEDEIPF